MSRKKKYVVCGAGNGGHAMAAELSLKGFDVKLFDFPEFEDALIPINKQKGITVLCEVEHFTNGKGELFAPVPTATTNVDEALDGADVVMIVVPGYAHERFIRDFCGRLKNGQVVVLNPGGVGGALQFKEALRKAGTPDVLVAETATMLYSCRRKGPAQVHVTGKKYRMPLGTFPNTDSKKVLQTLNDAYPEFIRAQNALETGLSRPSIAMHPVPVIMNAVKIEQMGSFPYKAYDITPTVARVIEAIDVERMRILQALGIKPIPIKDLLTLFYGTKGKDFYDTVTKVPAYQSNAAPPDLKFRYLTEDVPCMGVPAALLGNVLGVSTPTLTAMVNIVNAMHGVDYWKTGRTLEKLGLAGLSKDRIIQYLETGNK